MAKKLKSAQQWKVVKGLHINQLESACEEWAARGWNVFAILGPLGNLSIVLNRMLF